MFSFSFSEFDDSDGAYFDIGFVDCFEFSVGGFKYSLFFFFFFYFFFLIVFYVINGNILNFYFIFLNNLILIIKMLYNYLNDIIIFI